MFANLSDKFSQVLKNLSGKGKISESNIRQAMADVRTALLEADVHYQVVERFTQNVQAKALGEQVLSSLEPGQQMIKIVHDELVATLGGPRASSSENSVAQGQGEEGESDGEGGGEGGVMYVTPGPTIVMMCGLQGSGKTTTCGKLAGYFKKRGKSVMLVAADLQRPAAVHQLQVLADQVQNDPSISGSGRVLFYSEPDKVAEYGKAVGAAVTVCRHAVEAARREKIDVLLLDTAGRLHVNDELMTELKQVNQAVQPHQIMLVIDAMTGQDAVNSAKAFNDQLELDGVVITKFDSDTRGGAALSVKQVTGKPIKFVGVGEKLDALEEFHPKRVAGRILGMGDVLSLVEKAQEQVSAQEAAALQEKIAKGKMTMDDFLGQLRAIRRMGPMKNLLGMLPGIGNQLKDLPLDEKQIDRTEAIISSMTKAERRDVDLLDNSRRRRIARGSGNRPEDVSQLVKGFTMVSQMTKQFSGMGSLSRLKAMAGMAPGNFSGTSEPFGMPGGFGGGPGGMLPPGSMSGLGGSGGGKSGPKFKSRKKKSR